MIHRFSVLDKTVGPHGDCPSLETCRVCRSNVVRRSPPPWSVEEQEVCFVMRVKLALPLDKRAKVVDKCVKDKMSGAK